jgi:regulator of replication initiation timing
MKRLIASAASYKLISTATMLVFTTGCTSLKVVEFDGSPESRRGIAYFLPFTQFDTTVTWAASCDKSTKELSITPKVEAVQKTGPDPLGLYVIDYRSLSAFSKTSGVKVDIYDSGSIKSINASADDRTAELLSATLIAVGKVVKAVAVSGDDKVTCSADLIAALGTVETQKNSFEQKTGELKKATDALTALSARLTREGDSVTDTMRQQSSRQIGEVVALQLELDSLKADLTEALKAVTYVEKTVFPASSAESSSKSGLIIPNRVLKKWVTENLGETEDQLSTRMQGLSKSQSIWSEISTRPAFDGITSSSKGGADDGIRYRIAVPGELKFCLVTSCKSSEVAEPPNAKSGEPDIGVPVVDTPELVKSFPVRVLQRGTTFFLPFSSEAFTNGSLTATFSEGGIMTSAGYEQKRSQGEALASVAATLSVQIEAIVENSRSREKTDLDRLRERVDLAKAQKDLADAEAALVQADPDPIKDQIAALTSDTALKLAELANRNAEIALIAARSKLAEKGN